MFYLFDVPHQPNGCFIKHRYPSDPYSVPSTWYSTPGKSAKNVVSPPSTPTRRVAVARRDSGVHKKRFATRWATHLGDPRSKSPVKNVLAFTSGSSSRRRTRGVSLARGQRGRSVKIRSRFMGGPVWYREGRAERPTTGQSNNKAPTSLLGHGTTAWYPPQVFERTTVAAQQFPLLRRGSPARRQAPRVGLRRTSKRFETSRARHIRPHSQPKLRTSSWKLRQEKHASRKPRVDAGLAFSLQIRRSHGA